MTSLTVAMGVKLTSLTMLNICRVLDTVSIYEAKIIERRSLYYLCMKHGKD